MEYATLTDLQLVTQARAGDDPAFAELVRRYHPDRNGGDRSHEKALQDVIAAYTALKGAAAFA